MSIQNSKVCFRIKTKEFMISNDELSKEFVAYFNIRLHLKT